MAVKEFHVNLDLTKNELLNARLQNLGSDPGSPIAGQVYFNTGSNLARIYNGSSFKAVPYSGDIVNVDIAAGAAIALSKLAVDPLARANHTGTQTASTVSDFDTQVRTSRLDQMAVPTANISLNSNKITNLTDPTAAQDGATKAYVDAAIQGLDVKQSVVAATTANGALTTAFENGDTIDGVVLATGDRILIKDQSAAAENGIYTVQASGAPARADDSDSWDELISAFVFVEEGTANADNGFVCTIDAGGTLDSSAVTFSQFTGAAQIVAGAGLTKTTNTLDVGGTADRITVGADSVDIASSYVGQASITTLGTITTGIWNGTTIAIADGGTGATTAAAARTALSATGKYAALVGNGTDTSITVTHNLGTRDVDVTIYEAASPYAEIEVAVEHTDDNSATLKFNAAPATDEYKAVVIG